MPDPRTYDPQKVVVIFAGNIITGFAADSIIEVDFNEDSVTVEVGADGEFARVISRNESAEFKIRLMQTSPSNDVLDAMHAADKATGRGFAPLLVKDESGTAVAGAESAWVKKLPPLKRGKGIETNEWVLGCGKAYAHNCGN